jgi:hypothetical protein
VEQVKDREAGTGKDRYRVTTGNRQAMEDFQAGWLSMKGEDQTGKITEQLKQRMTKEGKGVGK